MDKLNNVHEAIIAIMNDIQYLKKDDSVGYGNSRYKAITDEKVRKSVRESMIKHGITIAPIKIDYDIKVDRWVQDDKMKQQVMITANIMYLVTHAKSNTSIEISSFGVGIDPQDKSPGKAMTYAQKYALLNLFCIPTGEDPDAIHSEALDVPKPKNIKKTKKKKLETPEQWHDLVKWVDEDNRRCKLALENYELTEGQETYLLENYGNYA